MYRNLTKFFIAFVLLIGSNSVMQSQINVTATAGTASASYTTISAAFVAINAGTHQGVINITVVGNTTEPAAPTALLKSAAPSSYTSITIKPSGGNWIINSAATPTANRGIIELSGADNVTIDGDDPATAGARNLTVQAAISASTGVTCVRFSSNSTTGADGADNCTLKNCILIGSRNSATSTTVNYGVNMSNYSTTSMTGGASSSLNTLIQNNEIRRCYNAIYANGATGYPILGTKILNNIIGSATAADNIGLRGVYVAYTSTTSGPNSAVIEGNDIRVGDVSTTGAGYSASIMGIEINTVNSGVQVLRNNIHDVLQPSTAGWGAYGINVTGAASCDNFTIANNFINNIVASKYSTTAVTAYTAYGIRLAAGATLMHIFHNTIVLNAAQTGTVANYTNYGIATTVTTPTISDFKNNIVINNNIGTGTVGFYVSSAASILSGALNNNNYFVNSGNVGYINAANQTTLAAWKTATGQDANALNVPVPFVSASDLHIDITNPGCMLLDGTGASGTNVTVDIDLQSRPSNPDPGADEFTLPACSGTPAFLSAAISPTTAVCNSGNFTMTGALAVPATGYSYQWQSSSSSSGPFTNISGAIAAINNANAVTSTTYYQVVATCSVSGLSGTSSVLTASISPNPSIVLTPSNGGYFCGSGTQSITATGADTYTWSPAGTLDVTSGPVVNSTTSTSITYSVVGTNTTTGCAATQTITVGPPAITINSTTPNFCGTGGTFTLTTTSADPGMTYSWTNLTPSATLSSTSGNTVTATISETSNFQVNGTGSGSFTGCSSVQYISVGVYPLPTASLTATPDAICPGGSSVINTGLSAGNFSAVCITPNPLTIPASAAYLANNGVATVALTSGTLDDGGWGNIPIGFSFNFFGTNYTSLNVGTNGVLQFGAYNATALGDYIIGALPNTVDPLGAIFIAANDLNCGTAGTPATYVRYWTEGYAPNRKFVIEYNVFQWGSTTNKVNVQAILYETLGVVDIVAKEIASTNSKSIGVNSPTGLIGAAAPNCAVTPNTANYWSAQTATILASAPQAWRFSPPSNYTTVWTATDINGSQTIANGTNVFTQTVTPIVSTNYSISYTNQTTGCTNAPGSAQVQMSVLPTTPPVGLNSVASATLVCVNASINLSTTYNASTTGLTFQWQSSTDGGTTWNNIVGATTPTISTSQTVTTQYRCEITSCGGTAGYAAPVTVTLQNPPAVAVSSSAANFCAPAGTPIAMNVTGTAVTYDWAPSAGLSATTGTSVTASPLESTTYTITATDAIGCTNTTTVAISSSPQVLMNAVSATPSVICSGSNAVLTASAAPAAGSYCQPQTSCTFPDIISNVTFATINNATGCDGASTSGFTLFSAFNPTVTVGSTYSLSVTTGGDIEGAAVWIDFNASGTYDAGELIFDGLAGTNPATYTASVTIPATAINGQTRMRVRCTYNANPIGVGPCGNASYGETEDYLITVTGGVEPVTYSWSPSTFLSATNSSTVNATSVTSSTDYIVTATSASGCQAIDTVSLTVNSTPASPVASGTTICSGNSATLTGTGAGTIGWYSSASGGAPIATGTSYTTPVLSSSATYYVQDSSSSGCVSQRTQVDVTVNATPVVSLGADITQCGGSTTLDASNTGATYLWSNSQTTQTINVNSTGQYNVVVTNQFNCSGYDTINVTINSVPVVNLGSDSSYCANSFVLNAQNPGNNYLWNTSATTQSISVTSSGSYNVVVTTPQGCIGTDTINITLASSPIVNLGADSTLCGGGSVILDAQNAGASYLWSDNSNSPILFVTTSGTYWVDVTNSSNCTTRDSINISIVSSPTIALSGAGTICSGDSIGLSATGASTYIWSPASVNGSTVMVAPSTTTTYTVTGTDANGCSDSDVITVTVNALPSVSATANISSICEGGSVTLTASGAQNYQWSPISSTGSSVNDSPTASVTYTVVGTDANGCSASAQVSVSVNLKPVVNLGPDVAACSGPILLDALNSGSTYVWSDNSASQTLSVNNSGNYWVNVTDANGCSSSDTVLITINSNPVVDLGADTTVCSGAYVLSAANPGASYLWNDGSTNQTLQVSTGGQYFVTITYVGGCSASDTVSIGVNTLPTVSLSLSTSSVCANGGVVTLDGENPAGGIFSGAGVSGNSFDPNGATGSVATITYSFTDTNGCSASASDSISLTALPSVSLVLGVDSACSADGIVTLTGESPAGGLFSGTSVTGNSFDPSVGFGTYQITYTYTDTTTGCSNSVNQNFVVDVCAGAISGNLAGITVYPNPAKDQFFIESVSMSGKVLLEIYNTQGKLVHSEQINATYRNQINSGDLSNGIYLLRILQGDEVKFFKLTISK